jgi:cardiolipin synthase
VKRLPNLLSAFRLLIAPYVWYLVTSRRDGEVLAWFFAAAVTDGLDGWLARRLHTESPFGQILDPIADKVLLDSVYLALAISAAVPWWLAWLVVGRDAVILLYALGALVLTKTRRSFPPSVWGKLSTIAQMGFVVAVVLDRAGFPLPIPPLGWITAAVTALSALDYARRALK